MKIMQIIPTLKIGGAEVLALNLAAAFKSLGHESILCCIKDPPEKGQLYPEARDKGIPVYYSYCKHEPRPVAVMRLAKIMRTLKPDVVHSHLPRTNPPSAVAAQLAGIRCIIASYHSQVIWANPRQKKWGRWTTWLQDGVTCDAKVVREQLAECCERAYRKSRVVHPGVTEINLNPGPDVEKLRERFKIGDNKKVVGCIARLAMVKDHFTLIDAAEIVLKKRDDVVFLLVGRGPIESKIRERIRVKSLEGKIIMAGYVTDINEAAALFDIFALTSLSEGFPVSILEAMMRGLPVVATRVGGVPELIEDGENGFLAPPGSPSRTAYRILSLLDDEALSDRISKRARETAAKYSITRTAQTLIDYYKEVTR